MMGSISISESLSLSVSRRKPIDRKDAPLLAEFDGWSSPFPDLFGGRLSISVFDYGVTAWSFNFVSSCACGFVKQSDSVILATVLRSEASDGQGMSEVIRAIS